MQARQLILYISMSLDGYIATKENDLSWLSVVEKEGEDYGYAAFNESVDTYIVGRKTYDIVRKLCGGEFPPAKQHQCYVITRQEVKSEKGINFYNGDMKELISELKKQKGKNIYCDGGAEIVSLLMKNDLIDEYIISIIPILLGDGIPLFKGENPTIKLKAIASKQFESGLVQVHYEKNNYEFS